MKDAVGGEAYTIEFECEAEDSKDLLVELTKSPYGQRAIELLNRAEFLPEEQHKTAEELKAEAEKEEEERNKNEERLKALGSREGKRELLNDLKDKFGEKFVESFEAWLEEKKKLAEEAIKKEDEEDKDNDEVQPLHFGRRSGL